MKRIISTFHSSIYRVARIIIRRIYRRHGWKIVAIGAEKIPKSGAVLIMANHLRFSDSIAIGLSTKRVLAFLAKSEYFVKDSFKSFIVALGFRAVGQISTDRSGGKARAALDEATERLKNGHAVGWHFEGTRSPDELLYDAHTGFAYVALATRATIVPAALVYPDPEDDHLVEVHYGELIPYSEYKDMKPYQIAELVVERVRLMSGQTRAHKKATIRSLMQKVFNSKNAGEHHGNPE